MALSRPDDYHDYFDDFQDEGTTVTPGRLRAMINKLLESTDIKIGEFQKMIGVNANSWGKFMHGKYKDPWSATQNGTYFAAAYFFYRERKLGKHALGKTRAHKASASGAGAAALTQKYDVSVVMLVRAASMPYQSFNNFMKASGDFGGRDNQCYHPAADLVERLRLATGKAKSKKRKALEAEVDAGIVDSRSGGPKLGLDPHGKYWMPVGAPFRMTKDSLGRNVFA